MHIKTDQLYTTKTMELNISTPSVATVASPILQPCFRNCHKFPSQHHTSLLKFKTFSSFNPSLHTVLLQQPSYKPRTISPPQETETMSTDKNTILDVLRLFDGLGIVVTPDIYATLVAECTRNRDAVIASELYTHMKRNYRMARYLKRSNGLLLFNRILMMFVICGRLHIAHELFDEMPLRNSVSLSVLVAGFVNNELFEEGLCLFVNMYECFVKNGNYKALQVVVVCVLKACVCLKNVDLGKMVHGWLIKMGYGREPFVVTTLIEFYGRCRCLSEANRVFFEQVQIDGHCNTSLWTSAIVNNCRGKRFEDLERIVLDMRRAGIRMNEYTISSLLKACGRIGDHGTLGRQVHAKTVKLAFVTNDFVMCSLVDMYARCGLFADARKVFDSIKHHKRSYSCWKFMATGFIQHGLWIEALKFLYQMKAAGLEPQQSMLDEVRLACGSMKQISSNYGDNLCHDYIEPG